MSNGVGLNRYASDWEKISKRLKLLFPCFFCGEDQFEKKECHHIDENKRNSNITNLIVLCIDCHLKVHNGKLTIPETFKGYILPVINKIKSFK